MAADPVAAATQLAGQTYAGAQERTAATQKALLDSLASNGTYQNSLNTAATAAAAPAPAGPSMGGGVPNVNAPMSGQMADIAGQGATQVNTMGHAALAAATALAAHQAMQEQQANTDYFSKAAAAMPLEQSRAASAGAQILGDLQAKREAAAAAKAQAAVQLQIAHEQLLAEQARTAAAGKTGGLTADQAFTVQNAMQKNATDQAIPPKYAVLLNGKITAQLNPTGQAISDVIHGGMDLNAALSKNRLPPSAAAEVAQQANAYYATLNQQGYYHQFGGAPPTIALPDAPGGLQDTLMALAGGATHVGSGIPSEAQRPASAPATGSRTVAAPNSWDKGLKPVFDSMGHIVSYTH